MLPQDVGWGGGKRQRKLIDEYDIEDTFKFPVKAPRTVVGEDPTQITNRERSISAPNVAIINADTVLPQAFYLRNQQRDIRRKFC